MPTWKEIRLKSSGDYIPRHVYDEMKLEHAARFEDRFEIVECNGELPENYCIGFDGIRNERKTYAMSGETTAFQDEEGNSKRQTVWARSNY